MLARWKKFLQLVTVECLQAIDHNVLGHTQFLGNNSRMGRPADRALEVLKIDQVDRSLKAHLALNSRRLAAAMAMLEVDSFMSEDAATLILSQLLVNPRPTTICPAGCSRARPRPLDNRTSKYFKLA